VERTRQAGREGKAPPTQAGEFFVRRYSPGKAWRARSAKQAIAIGLSKPRRAGVKLPPPKKGTVSGTVSDETRRKGEREYFNWIVGLEEIDGAQPLKCA
jgi:Family of unknown function (DUF6496)